MVVLSSIATDTIAQRAPRVVLQLGLNRAVMREQKEAVQMGCVQQCGDGSGRSMNILNLCQQREVLKVE